MHGFISIVSKNKPLVPVDIKWKNDFSFQSKTITRSKNNTHYQIEQHTLQKLLPEKLWLENDDFIFVNEGVIYNIEDLLISYQAKNKEELISLMVKKDTQFFNQFNGDFSGFIFLKKENKWLAFNNRSGSKKLYFFKNESYFLFSTDLFTLIQCLKSLDISFTLNRLSAYLMLNNGYLFEDLTLVDEVSKLCPGSFLSLVNHKLNTEFYFHLKDIEKTTDRKEKIIQKLDKKFKKAVEQGFNFNKKYNFQNISTLSGGLDSRMTALVAYSLGYVNQTFLNFSESGYADQVIAKEIADYYDLPILQYDFQASLLLDIDRVIAVNDGIANYINCSHIFSIIKELNLPSSGIFHGGIIGDTVMGSSTGNSRYYNQALYPSPIIFEPAKEYIEGLIKQYDGNTEMVVTYNAILTSESNGFLYFDLIGGAHSPFTDNAFFEYAFSIPEKYRFNRSIYIDWINQLQPDVSRFIWETIGGKPTNNKQKIFLYRLKRAIIKRLPIQNKWKKGMNPESVWFNNDPSIKQKLDAYFFENLNRIEDTQLKNDTKRLYEIGGFDSKARCLTLVGAIKLLFS